MFACGIAGLVSLRRVCLCRGSPSFDEGGLRLPKNCEVIEMGNSADVVGYSCPGAASKECSDCGIRLCEDHAETCGTCFSLFCPPCRFLHRGQHSKPARRAESEKELKT